MNEELRDIIGKASYEAALGEYMDVPWEELNDDAKAVNVRSAEAAISAFLEHAKKDFLKERERKYE